MRARHHFNVPFQLKTISHTQNSIIFYFFSIKIWKFLIYKSIVHRHCLLLKKEKTFYPSFHSINIQKQINFISSFRSNFLVTFHIQISIIFVYQNFSFTNPSPIAIACLLKKNKNTKNQNFISSFHPISIQNCFNQNPFSTLNNSYSPPLRRFYSFPLYPRLTFFHPCRAHAMCFHAPTLFTAAPFCTNPNPEPHANC